MDISSFFSCSPTSEHTRYILGFTTETILPPSPPQSSPSQLLTSKGEPSVSKLEERKRGRLMRGITMAELARANVKWWGGVEEEKHICLVEEEEEEESQKRDEVVRQKRRRASVESQSMAARHRRMKIRDRTWKLGSLLPSIISSSTKLDTASMLDLAIKYLQFLEAQHLCLQNERTLIHFSPPQPGQSEMLMINGLLSSPQIQYHLSRSALCIVTNRQARFLGFNCSYHHHP